MEQLLLVTLKLGNLSLLAVVVSFELLHQLLVRLEEGRVLNERCNLVALVGFCLVWFRRNSWFSKIQVVSQGRVELDGPR